ncbi:hypothetical protein [Streptomyces sp. NPDC093089]|uniref:hypothetical protein n=1 Tax=Streptomyces sp. NPDC093089 TaxID=3366024 RepID=UPI00382AD618
MRGGPAGHCARERAQWQGERYGFEDVLLIAELVAVSPAREERHDCTAKYGRHGISGGPAAAGGGRVGGGAGP